ncbi:MAG: VOC family protein [Acidimicrobiia bacterium]|nr:VOC family protein [Acidimicrobiia bacterium]
MAVRFDAMGIIVEDMEKSLAFYALLGLEIPPGTHSEGHVELNLARGLRLMLDTVDIVRSFSRWEPPTGGHRIALAFLCGSPEEVDDRHRLIVAAGNRSHVAPFDAPWGQRYATVLDPDGNPVDLFAPLPATDSVV